MTINLHCNLHTSLAEKPDATFLAVFISHTRNANKSPLYVERVTTRPQGTSPPLYVKDEADCLPSPSNYKKTDSQTREVLKLIVCDKLLLMNQNALYLFTCAVQQRHNVLCK